MRNMCSDSGSGSGSGGSSCCSDISRQLFVIQERNRGNSSSIDNKHATPISTSNIENQQRLIRLQYQNKN